MTEEQPVRRPGAYDEETFVPERKKKDRNFLTVLASTVAACLALFVMDKAGLVSAEPEDYRREIVRGVAEAVGPLQAEIESLKSSPARSVTRGVASSATDTTSVVTDQQDRIAGLQMRLSTAQEDLAREAAAHDITLSELARVRDGMNAAVESLNTMQENYDGKVCVSEAEYRDFNALADELSGGVRDH